MPTAAVIHLDRLVRERIGAALTVRGMETTCFGEVESALSYQPTPDVVLVDPRILIRETYDVGARFAVATGRAVRIVALTHVASSAEAEAFQRHGATLLIQPVQNYEMIAVLVGAPGKPMGLAEAEAKRAENKRANPVRLAAMPNSLPEPSETAALVAPELPDGRSPLVLIVDDDEDCRSLFEDALAAKGYSTHSTSSVPAAFRWIRNGNVPDVILSDIHMPIFDGFEMKDELDRTAGRPVPFIAITGEDDAEKYELAMRLGAVALLAKPVNLRRLFRLVRATIERSLAEAR